MRSGHTASGAHALLSGRYQNFGPTEHNGVTCHHTETLVPDESPHADLSNCWSNRYRPYMLQSGISSDLMQIRPNEVQRPV